MSFNIDSKLARDRIIHDDTTLLEGEYNIVIGCVCLIVEPQNPCGTRTTLNHASDSPRDWLDLSYEVFVVIPTVNILIREYVIP